jgi:hypothetical protein
MDVAGDQLARSSGIAIGHCNDDRLLQAQHVTQVWIIDERVHDRQPGCTRITKKIG